MLEAIYNDTQSGMDECVQAMLAKFLTIRTGKVSTAILNNIRIDYYGSSTPIDQVGSVVLKDATTISIVPWEKPLIQTISKAIAEANIGVHPNEDGEGIKLFFPAMTTEQRQANAKIAKGIAEEFKVSVRNIRKNSNDRVKKLQKDKEVTEDESRQALSKIQEITDAKIEEIEQKLSTKEKEILKI